MQPLARARGINGATATRRCERHNGNAMAMEGATAMDGVLGVENGAIWGDNIAVAV